jgi:DNA transformation protein
MPCSAEFRDHALDLLSGLGPVEARRLFGGYGLFLSGVMLGLLDDDELFLRFDEESRPRFEAAGCRMWTYGRMTETHYLRPPDEAHEDAEAMLPWARLGLASALRRKAAKDAEAAARAARRAERERKAVAAERVPARRKPVSARASTGSARTKGAKRPTSAPGPERAAPARRGARRR